jgi:hypothetical protein
MNDEYLNTGREAIVAYLKMLSRQTENHEKPQSG